MDFVLRSLSFINDLLNVSVLIILGYATCISQNLIVNPSLENLISIPDDEDQLINATGWSSAYLTPDLHHINGYNRNFYAQNIPPQDGEAYLSFRLCNPHRLHYDTIFREFPQGKFNQVLRSNRTYVFTVFALADPRVQTNRLQILFTSDSLYNIDSYPLSLSPQLEIKSEWIGGIGEWKLHKGCVDDIGDSRYFTIGFFDTAFAYKVNMIENRGNVMGLDNFMLFEWESKSIIDTTICTNEILYFKTGRFKYFDIYYQGKKVELFETNTPGRYELEITLPNCNKSQKMVVNVKDCNCGLYVPNIFTPNGDNINDVFLPTIVCDRLIRNYSLNIYNRWGELIFQSNDENVGWNGYHFGNAAEEGVYVAKISYTIENSDEGMKETTNYSSVTLIR